jgi:hypothetical protein
MNATILTGIRHENSAGTNQLLVEPRRPERTQNGILNSGVSITMSGHEIHS